MDFSELKIKQYDFWDLYLHQNQYPYIGRCYASARRENADLATDMNFEEREELFSRVISEWAKSIEHLFGQFRPNIACFGNEWNHLHWHLIPRYKDKIEFNGINFTDPNPNGNYSPYVKMQLGKKVILEIKDFLRKRL